MSRFFCLVLFTIPAVTLLLDPSGLSDPAWSLYLSNVILQMGGLVILCGHLWHRWRLQPVTAGDEL